MKTLTQLRREKVELLKKAKDKDKSLRIRKLIDTFAKQKEVEKRKLRAEISALKSPRSTAARRTVIKLTVKAGRLFLKSSRGIANHLAAVSREQGKRPMKRKSTKNKRRR